MNRVKKYWFEKYDTDSLFYDVQDYDIGQKSSGGCVIGLPKADRSYWDGKKKCNIPFEHNQW